MPNMWGRIVPIQWYQIHGYHPPPFECAGGAGGTNWGEDGKMSRHRRREGNASVPRIRHTRIHALVNPVNYGIHSFKNAPFTSLQILL